MAIRQITFNYNANGGAGAPSSSTDSFNVNSVPYTKTKQISSTKPSRTYYTFLGWGSSAGATSATWASSQTLSFTWASLEQLNVTMNFFAVWKAETATVTYNANGGTGAPSSQTVSKNTWFALRTGVPTRQYYRFVGWATSSTATAAEYQPGGQARIVGNLTLYAVWEKQGDVVTTSNGTIGSPLTLNISKVMSSYTDEITFQFGSTSGTIASGTTAESITWTPPLSLASEIPNASSGVLVITCATYNGSSLVGTTTTQATLTVPQSLTPTASVSYVDTDSTCLSWGVYVQSRSKLAFTITASGQYGATITAYSTQVNGATYSAATFTTDVLLYSGANSYTIKVTDSRGYQTTLTGSFTVEVYSTPSVSLVSCDRNDADPEQIDIEFDFSVASVSGNNSAEYSFDYKEKTASSWTQGAREQLGSYSGTISDYLSAIDQGSEYDIRVNVYDSFQSVSVETEVGVSGNMLFNQRHRGGLGLLMKSQAEDQMDVGKKSVFHGKVKEIYGSTVGSHSASGNYAKILTFGTNAQVGKNLAPTNSWNTGRRWWGSNLNSTGLLGQVLETLPVGTYTISWKHTLTAIPSDTTTELKVGKYVRVYYGGSYHILSGYSLTTIPTYAVGDSYDVQATITIDENAVGQSFEVLAYCGQDNAFYATLTEYQIEIGSQKTSFEPYVNMNDLNINSPITLEYIKTGDSAPTRLTITFNRDFSLASYTKDASADAYLVNSATATWDLYIGKSNTSDKVEILDFHDPWSNTDLTVDWEDSSISTLPTGAVSATPVNTVISESPSGVSVATGTWKTVASITLPRGIWILSGYTQFNSNSTGIRSTVLSASQDSGTSTRNMSSDLNNNTGNNSGKLHFVDVYQIASQVTYYLNAYQNSGSAITTYGRLTAVKLI